MQEVPNAAWVNHTFMPYGQPNRTRADARLHPYTRNQIWLYTQAGDLDQYCDTAQIVNYVQYRRAARVPACIINHMQARRLRACFTIKYMQARRPCACFCAQIHAGAGTELNCSVKSP